MKKVSIIVPVYNASKFLDKSIGSIINQTYKNIELILINDGSKDNSYEIINNYANNYDFIKAYTQENMGAAKTRNRGIKLSKGDYITFVDADDELEETYIEALINNSNNYDIVICGYKVFDYDNKYLYEKKPLNNNANLLSQMSSVCKLYKRSLIIDNNIEFASQKVGEDMIFALNCFSKTDKINMIPNTGYLYKMNPNSVMKTLTKKDRPDLFNTIKIIDDTIDLKRFGNLRYFLYLKTIVLNIIKQPKDLTIEELNEIYIDSFKWLDQRLKKDNKRLRIKHYQNVTFKINAINNIFIIAYKLKVTKLLIKIIKK